MQQGQFQPVVVGRIFHGESSPALAQDAQRCCDISFREIIKQSPEQLDLTLKLSLVLVGLDGITSRDPFQTKLLY